MGKEFVFFSKTSLNCIYKGNSSRDRGWFGCDVDYKTELILINLLDLIYPLLDLQ